ENGATAAKLAHTHNRLRAQSDCHFSPAGPHRVPSQRAVSSAVGQVGPCRVAWSEQGCQGRLVRCERQASIVSFAWMDKDKGDLRCEAGFSFRRV
ncbi:hypothetical protein ANANG_G00070810, partial [Anguilla anguilla]